ncbi:MAG: element excision factor XisH family protein [bacterium]|nr:element excision factor XisH family protein [bacterium]
MPAFDQCHDQVVRALEKEGWRLEAAPYRVFTKYRSIYIDAEFTHQDDNHLQHIILVEVKCFPDENSTTTDLYNAIGQYLVYRDMLIETETALPLYLTVPYTIFEKVFDAAIQRVIKDNRIDVIVIDLEQEEIVQWIESST